MIPPLQMITNIGKDYKTIKINNNMPGQQPYVKTVKISLDEYNEMRQSLDTLHNALEDNKVIIRDPYSRGAYMTYHTFTRDAALNKIAGRYYEMEERYKATQANNDHLARSIDKLTSTRWYMLGRWLSKRILMRK